LGGIPLDEIGATGFGVAVAAEAAQPYCGLKLDGARVVIQGFGAVGRHAAHFLAQKGARLVGVSDARGAIADPDGLDLAQLSALKAEGRSVGEAKRGQRLAADELISTECDIWIPAARPDVLREDNVDRLKTRLFVQGANIPATAEAERRMHARGILSIPDFIANAGGVITAAVELRGGTEKSAFEAIAEKIAANTRATLEAAKAQGVPPREAATLLARTRIARAMAVRRWHR
jgi:glutamate dehydrogenase (NAD(P)+)